MRVEYDFSSIGVYDKCKLPFFQGYFISGVIQYCRKSSHFRTVKCFGRDRTDVLDGGKVLKLNSYEDRLHILEGDKEWVSYIASYRASDATRLTTPL